MADFLLNTKKLDAGYDKSPVVSGVDLEINRGQIITLIGPNGCGKTTLLKTISTELSPIAGCLFVEDISVTEIKKNDLAKKMAVMFTERNIRESISSFEVVALGRYPYTGFLGKLSEEDLQVVKEAMLNTSVWEYKDLDFTKLSDGQRQRVLLARALAQKPDIMLLDEPTTFLDVKYRLEFLSTLMKLAKSQGFAVIMSLHELDMAKQISDKIICVKDGRVDKCGSPEEIFSEGYINQLFDIRLGSFDEKLTKAILG